MIDDDKKMLKLLSPLGMLLGLILSVVMGFGVGAVLHFSEDPRFLLTVAAPAVVSSYIVYIIIYSFSTSAVGSCTYNQVLNNRNKDNLETEEVITKLSIATENLKTSVDHVKFVGDSIEKFSKLNEKNELVRAAGQSALKTFMRNYTIDENADQMSLSGQNTSLAAYAEFWKFLLNEHKKNEKPVKVFATHSKAIEILMGEYEPWRTWMNIVNDYQSELAANGCQIFRVLVGPEDDAKSPDCDSPLHQDNQARYEKVVKDMKDIGVNMAFLTDGRASNGSLPSVDFILAKYNDGKMASFNWTSIGPAKYIGGCTVSAEEEDYRQYKSIWDSYIRYVRQSIEAKETTKPANFAETLNRDFMKKYQKLG